MSRMRKGFVASALVLGAVAVGLVAGRAQASSPGPLAPTSAKAGVVGGAAAAPAVSPQLASNTLFFSNLGPGGSFQSTGFCVNGPTGPCGGRFDEAASFVPAVSGRVTQIDVGVTHFAGTNAAVVKLAQDNGGVPGAVLGSWPIANQPTYGATCCATTIPINPSISIGAGRTYWVIAVAGASNTDDALNFNYNGTTGIYAYSTNGTSWTLLAGPIGAFDVIGCYKICHV